MSSTRKLQHARQRSKTRITSMDPKNGNEDDGDDWRYADKTQDRLPVWQVAGLVCLSLGMLYLVLGYVHPRTRAAQALSSSIPKCFPLDDKDTVRLLGPQNTLVNHKIATKSEWAQTLFNLGLLQLHGFNQIEATKNFEACLRADPRCAMCYWGLAYAQGPMPNKVAGKLSDSYPVFQPTHATDAHQHMQKAVQYNQQALGSQLDVALVRRDKQYIEALAERFSKGAGALKGGKWMEQEAKYAQRMQEVAESGQDADAFALAAEAYLNLSPWDYYNQDGSLKPTAATAEQLLRKALAINPKQTHALHLHIHIAEAAVPVSRPGSDELSAARALSSAKTLTDISPQNGHLLHMPSHTFLRVGQYKAAVMVNKAAYDYDLARGQQCITPYLPEHNANMLVYAASMAGMLHTAEAFATGMRNLRSRVPDAWMAKGNEWVNLPTLYIRYGMWSKLMTMPGPVRDSRGVTALGGSQYASVVYHTGRLLAQTARAQAAAQQVLGLQDVTAFDLARRSLELREKEVAHELRKLQIAARSIPAEPRTKPGPSVGLYASGYASLARIMLDLADARMHMLRNNTAAAVEVMRDAVAAEDELGYMEPPRVHQPSRQCLGWLLLQAGQLDEAWKVYSKDLQQHPNNIWSLLGLKQVAEARHSGVTEGTANLKEAWTDAEVHIDSSCPALANPHSSGPQ